MMIWNWSEKKKANSSQLSVYSRAQWKERSDVAFAWDIHPDVYREARITWFLHPWKIFKRLEEADTVANSISNHFSFLTANNLKFTQSLMIHHKMLTADCTDNHTSEWQTWNTGYTRKHTHLTKMVRTSYHRWKNGRNISVTDTYSGEWCSHMATSSSASYDIHLFVGFIWYVVKKCSQLLPSLGSLFNVSCAIMNWNDVMENEGPKSLVCIESSLSHVLDCLRHLFYCA